MPTNKRNMLICVRTQNVLISPQISMCNLATSLPIAQASNYVARPLLRTVTSDSYPSHSQGNKASMSSSATLCPYPGDSASQLGFGSPVSGVSFDDSAGPLHASTSRAPRVSIQECPALELGLNQVIWQLRQSAPTCIIL